MPTLPRSVVDTSKWSRRNIWRLSTGESCVRPGMRRLVTAGTGRRLVGGFTVRNEYVDDVVHYVFDVDEDDDVSVRGGGIDLVGRIYDENFLQYCEVYIRASQAPRVITYAAVQGEIIIASPDFPTQWGLIGSSFREAVKVESANPSITVLDIPNGICTQVMNFSVIAKGRTLYFSEPVSLLGGDVRSILPTTINLPGNIFGLHEVGGMIVAVTSSGTYGADISSIFFDDRTGAIVAEFRLLNHHGAISYASSCTVRGRCYAATKDGFTAVDTETNTEINVSDPMQPRAFGVRIAEDDYRLGKTVASDVGPVISFGNLVHRTDLTASPPIFTWWETPLVTTREAEVVDVLHGYDGAELLLCHDGVYAVDGNMDGEQFLDELADSQPTGVIAGIVETFPTENRLVRHVHVGGAVGGSGQVGAAVRGKRRRLTPRSDPDGITIGADSWGTAAKRYTTTPIARCRIDFGDSDSKATGDVGVEVAVDGCLSRFHRGVVVEFSASAVDTPDNVGGT